MLGLLSTKSPPCTCLRCPASFFATGQSRPSTVLVDSSSHHFPHPLMRWVSTRFTRRLNSSRLFSGMAYLPGSLSLISKRLSHVLVPGSAEGHSVFRTSTAEPLGYVRAGQATMFPLDRELNLPKESYSLEVRQRVAFKAQRSSWNEVVSTIWTATAAPTFPSGKPNSWPGNQPRTWRLSVDAQID